MKDTNGAFRTKKDYEMLSPEEKAKIDLRRIQEVAPVIIEYCREHNATLFFNADGYTIGNKNASMVPSIKK